MFTDFTGKREIWWIYRIQNGSQNLSDISLLEDVQTLAFVPISTAVKICRKGY